jgi:hypothetical protein
VGYHYLILSFFFPFWFADVGLLFVCWGLGFRCLSCIYRSLITETAFGLNRQLRLDKEKKKKNERMKNMFGVFGFVFPSFPIKNLVPLASLRMMDSDGWMGIRKERKVHFLFLHPPSSLTLQM